eukprot:423274-Karenia_brevis.AAC.1
MAKMWKCGCNSWWYQCEQHGKNPHEREDGHVHKRSRSQRDTTREFDFAYEEARPSRTNATPEPYKLGSSFLCASRKLRFGHLCDDS